MRLKDKVVIITGAARGIGRAIAESFAAEGARLALADVDREALEAAQTELGGLAVPTDVSDEVAVRAMAGATMRHYGRIDILLNNAGICPLTPFEALGRAEWDRVIAINLTGAFLCSQAAVPHMQAANYGRIINISSVAGKMGGVAGRALCRLKSRHVRADVQPGPAVCAIRDHRQCSCPSDGGNRSYARVAD